MSKETRYEATDVDVEIIIRGHEEFRKSLTHPHIIGNPTFDNIAVLLNAAYQRGRNEQRDDIRKALGV